MSTRRPSGIAARRVAAKEISHGKCCALRFFLCAAGGFGIASLVSSLLLVLGEVPELSIRSMALLAFLTSCFGATCIYAPLYVLHKYCGDERHNNVALGEMDAQRAAHQLAINTRSAPLVEAMKSTGEALGRGTVMPAGSTNHALEEQRLDAQQAPRASTMTMSASAAMLRRVRDRRESSPAAPCTRQP